MKVHRGIPKEKIPGLVLTVGSYDGVHLGHQRLLSQVVEKAHELGGQSALLTFHPHPRVLLHGQDAPRMLTTREERNDKLDALGIDHLIELPFDKDLAEMSPVHFVRDLLVNELGVKCIVIGYDHRFGKNREGNIDLLLEYAEIYGFQVVEIPAQVIDEVKVSSTKIRRAVKEGKVDLAESYLGAPYALRGRVVHGDRLGRRLGYPTANLQVEDPSKILPADGIYMVRVYLGKILLGFGMMNVGARPTVSESQERRLEVHVLDLDRDLYGEELNVEFLRYIRGQQRFENTELLAHAIAADEISCRRIIAELERD